MEPFLNPEKAGHFRHTAANGRGIVAQTFQAESKLMPDLIGDNLAVRVLPDKPDTLTLLPYVPLLQRLSQKCNAAAGNTMGCQTGFQLPEQSTFSAPGRTAENEKIAPLNGQITVLQRGYGCIGVVKRQVSDCKRFHRRSSFLRKMVGVRQSAKNTAGKLRVNGETVG